MGRFTKQTGATIVEYALLLFLVAIVVIVSLSLLGAKSSSKLSTQGNAIRGATGAPATTTTTECRGNPNGHGNDQCDGGNGH